MHQGNAALLVFFMLSVRRATRWLFHFQAIIFSLTLLHYLNPFTYLVGGFLVRDTEVSCKASELT